MKKLIKFIKDLLRKGKYMDYVNRLATESDFDINDLTAGRIQEDGLDLSAIVPSGASAVNLKLEIASLNGNTAALQVFTDANEKSETYAAAWLQNGGKTISNAILPINGDRLMDYLLNIDGADMVSVTVLGWFI